MFVLPRHRLADARLVGVSHMRADLRSDGGGRIQAIAFRAADTALGEFLFSNRGSTVHVAGSLSGSYWNGNRTVEFPRHGRGAGFVGISGQNGLKALQVVICAMVAS